MFNNDSMEKSVRERGQAREKYDNTFDAWVNCKIISKLYIYTGDKNDNSH